MPQHVRQEHAHPGMHQHAAIYKLAKTAELQAQEAGRTPMEALSAAVPQLLAATDLSLPCSQMCEAVVSSCGCKTELRFGPLLDAYLAAGTLAVPRGFTAQMFGQLYSSPICSLYGNTSAPGFAGHCDPLPQTCKDPQRWCDAQEADSAGAEVRALAVQHLQARTAVGQGPGVCRAGERARPG